MKFPFDTQAFLEVFKNYNVTVWPLQILIFVMAIACCINIVSKPAKAGKFVFVILSLFWLWMGSVYHLKFFSGINKAAYIFGALFILQSILLMLYGLRRSPTFSNYDRPQKTAGVIFILYALIIYPIIGFFTSHAYPYSPTFGLPCPTTIFTFGILLLLKERLPTYLVIIPVIWSFIGVTAAAAFGIMEDIALPVSSLTYLFFASRKYKRANRADSKLST